MSVGTLLCGIAMAVMVAAWVARPFRRAPGQAVRGRALLAGGLLLALGAAAVAVVVGLTRAGAILSPAASSGRNALGEIGLGLMALPLGISMARKVWNAPVAPRSDEAQDQLPDVLHEAPFDD